MGSRRATIGPGDTRKLRPALFLYKALLKNIFPNSPRPHEPCATKLGPQTPKRRGVGIAGTPTSRGAGGPKQKCVRFLRYGSQAKVEAVFTIWPLNQIKQPYLNLTAAIPEAKRLARPAWP